MALPVITGYKKSSITDKYLKDTSDNYLFEWNIADDRLLFVRKLEQ